MAYSMFERPKLHDVKSLKFYPEQHDHRVSFRHKKLSPNFDLTVEKTKENKRNHSLEAHSSTYKKCPIYVHSFDTHHQNEGDFVMKKDKKKKNKPNHKSIIQKLEEKYWANWKPDKNSINSESSEIKVIKSAPERRRKIKVPSTKSHNLQIPSGYNLQKNTSVSQEIQTEDLTKKEEEIQSEEVKEETIVPITEITKKETKSCETLETKFLKHTDSLILTYKKQKKGQEERFDQPKCIRLYKKPGKLSNYIKGGSYPLKPCLKEENKNKGKLGRPGSPMILSNHNRNKLHRR